MTKHFFIAGAQRSGTTYLYQVLDAHPEIEMNKPVRPEPKYFLKPNSQLYVDQYIQTYFHEQGAKMRGEKSASYMEAPGTAQRIAHCFPDAKILFILRDPVERAISHYRYSVSNKLENKPMSEALLDEQAQDRPYDRSALSVSPFAYLRRGRYVEYIDAYAQHFPREQIRILVFEDFIGSVAQIQDLYGFLGVSTNFVPDCINEPANESEPDGQEPTAEIYQFLRAYFRGSNNRLANRYGVSVAAWQR